MSFFNKVMRELKRPFVRPRQLRTSSASVQSDLQQLRADLDLLRAEIGSVATERAFIASFQSDLQRLRADLDLLRAEIGSMATERAFNEKRLRMELSALTRRMLINEDLKELRKDSCGGGSGQDSQ